MSGYEWLIGRILYGFTRFYRVLLGFIGSYLDLPSFTGFYLEWAAILVKWALLDLMGGFI